LGISTANWRDIAKVQEEWRTTDENCRYEVSSLGRVRRVGAQHIVKGFRGGSNYKYLRVCMYSETGKRQYRYVHRLVAIAFIPNLFNKKEVNHKNADTEDNRAVNLEWVTREENERHKHTIPTPEDLVIHTVDCTEIDCPYHNKFEPTGTCNKRQHREWLERQKK
jgi:hypothetical protein